jgi:hypothetical protein
MFLEATDLTPFADIDADKAEAMIQDAESTAVLVAPCLADLETAKPGETPEQAKARTLKRNAVKAIIRGAVLRWDDSGQGALVQQSAGPFAQQVDTRQPRKAMFWPSEIEQLQSICSSTTTGKAFAVDTTGPDNGHMPWCSLMFGATFCSCGVDIAGRPIFKEE